MMEQLATLPLLFNILGGSFVEFIAWTYYLFVLSAYRFLGYVDKIGIAYTSDTLATGFGSYVARVSSTFFIFKFIFNFCLQSFICKVVKTNPK